MMQNPNWANSPYWAYAWIAFGALVVLIIAILIIREIPAMRRELKVFSM